MKNIPEVKLGLVAVSRDCFIVSLSRDRRSAFAAEVRAKPTEPADRTRLYTRLPSSSRLQFTQASISWLKG